jgi:hypothetical protein
MTVDHHTAAQAQEKRDVGITYKRFSDDTQKKVPAK